MESKTIRGPKRLAHSVDLQELTQQGWQLLAVLESDEVVTLKAQEHNPRYQPDAPYVNPYLTIERQQAIRVPMFLLGFEEDAYVVALQGQLREKEEQLLRESKLHIEKSDEAYKLGMKVEELERAIEALRQEREEKDDALHQASLVRAEAVAANDKIKRALGTLEYQRIMEGE